MLRTENATIRFGGLVAVNSVNMHIKEGQITALIGPNGAGKSTLINAIGGQGPATSGEVIFDGHNVTHLSPDKHLHKGMARSFQGNNLFWKMTILDNVLLALHGGEKNHFQMFKTLETRKEFLDKAEELLKTVDLWEKRHMVPTLLSYGDQRLLEMMLAFTCNPKMVLLDEPSAGLPTVEAGRFAEKLRKISEGTTLLFCAHDLELVFTLADRIMVLYFGQILKIGKPDEIRNDPQVKEIYLGTED